MSKRSEFMSTLDFEVSKKPLFVQLGEQNVQKCNDKVAIINESTNQVLSYMSPNYRLFNNEEFMDLAGRISDNLGLELDHYTSYKGGKKVLAAFKQTDKKHTLCGYDFENHIVLYDGRDGSTCLSIGSIGYLNRCANMFTSMRSQERKGNVLKINHSSKLDEMLADFEASLEIYGAMQQQTLERIERLNDIKVSQKNLYSLIGGWTQLTAEEVRNVAYGNYDTDDVSTRKKNIVDGLVNSWSIESAELGQNGFALHNTLTHYMTHKRNKSENDVLFADFGKKELQTIQFAEALV